MTFTGHEDYDSLKPYIAITDMTRKNLRTRFRGAALAASLAARGGPGNPFDSQPPGLTALVAVSVHAVRGASSPSVAHENSQLLTQPAVNQRVAERTRFGRKV